MPVHACVLINVEAGLTLEATEHLIKLPSVGMVLPTAGPHDLMILARADTPTELGRIIIDEYQKAPGVESTLTLLILGDLTSANWMAS